MGYWFCSQIVRAAALDGMNILIQPSCIIYDDFMAAHFGKMDYERKWTGRFAVY